jgi:hypothetical protein
MCRKSISIGLALAQARRASATAAMVAMPDERATALHIGLSDEGSSLESGPADAFRNCLATT